MSIPQPVVIQQVRIPDTFDDDAAQVLGEIAELVRRSRESVWGTGDLVNDAEDLFRDLHDPWERVVLLTARTDGQLAGRAEVRLPLIVETRSAQIFLAVDPDHETGGVGSELLAAAESVAQSEARRVMVIHSEHPGPQDIQGDGRIGSATGALPIIDPDAWISAADGSGRLPVANRQTRFAVRFGYELQTVSDVSRIRVPLDPHEHERLSSEVESHPGAEDYRIHTWMGAAPQNWLDSLAKLHERIPSDSFVPPRLWAEEPWDADRVRRTEALREENGDISLMSVVEHVPSRELVGMTEVVLPGPDASICFQDETVVLRDHRGRRLGLRLKLANLAALERQTPNVHSIYVWTHSGNIRMNWVNRRLGAQTLGRSAVWSRRVGIE
ncbi:MULTISPECIES: GNAT family N-acetyltransferase [Kocuria]|uniref:GNAT family N-acetyltransferase n=2 Tax=Kocuria TaxID=57493 RepID=A0A846TJY0_9MICC|nr:GNAT family N-acetyltransferase [Kocuria sp. CPCC 104605]NKE09508.1 GNAT family N-acetyltransferase [Kocuria subflava]